MESLIKRKTVLGEPVADKIRVPLRVSLIGGGVDFPEYYEGQSEGGHVISCSIKKYVTLENEEAKCDYWGRGLGASSAKAVAYAIKKHFGNDQTCIPDIAFHNERQSNVLGKQDHWGCFVPGLKQLIFYKDKTEANPITNPEILKFLQETSILIPIGNSRDAQKILKDQAKRTEVNRGILSDLSNLAKAAHECLMRLEFVSFWNLFRRAWELKKQLSPGVCSGLDFGKFDMIQRTEGFQAGKICGAGGGGFILAMFTSARHAKLALTAKEGAFPLEIDMVGPTFKGQAVNR